MTNNNLIELTIDNNSLLPVISSVRKMYVFLQGDGNV